MPTLWSHLITLQRLRGAYKFPIQYGRLLSMVALSDSNSDSDCSIEDRIDEEEIESEFLSNRIIFGIMHRVWSIMQTH